MIRAFLIAIFVLMTPVASVDVFAGNLDGLLSDTEGDFNSQTNSNQSHIKNEAARQKRAAAEAKRKSWEKIRSQMSSAETQVCFQMRTDDQRNACLSQPMQVRNDNARNILLGNCYAMDNNGQRSGFDTVCINGKQGCHALKSDDAQYHCNQCGGTRRWLATYAVGSMIQCF